MGVMGVMGVYVIIHTIYQHSSQQASKCRTGTYSIYVTIPGTFWWWVTGRCAFFFLSSHLGVSAVGSPAALLLRFCIAELITSYLNWAFWWDDYRWLIEVNEETAQCRVIRVRSMTTLFLKACPAVKQLGWLAVSLAKRAVPQDRWAWWPNHQTRAEQGQNSSNIFGDHIFVIFCQFFTSLVKYIVLFSGWDVVVGCLSSVIYHSHLAHL